MTAPARWTDNMGIRSDAPAKPDSAAAKRYRHAMLVRELMDEAAELGDELLEVWEDE